MEKVWLKHYHKDVPQEINPEKYSSLNAVFAEVFKEYSDLPAYTNFGKVLTYKEIEEKSRAFAAYLQSELGLKKGDKFAIMLPNVLQYPIAMIGIIRAGLTVVNVNPLYTAKELKHQLTDSEAKGILVLENFAYTLEAVVKETAVNHVMVAKMGDCLGTVKGLLTNFVVKNIKKMVPKWNIDNVHYFNSVISKGANLSFTEPSMTRDDYAFLQYTGGTTGKSKGAILTHKNMLANIEQASAWFSPLLTEKKETIITALPLYHIFSLTANCLTFMRFGALNVLITNPRDIPGFVKELGKHKFTALTGVNTLFNALLLNEDFSKIDFSSLKLTLGGGMAVQEAVARKWQAVTQKPLLEAYGLTETSPAACINPTTLTEFNGKIGLPISSTEASIRDSNGDELGFGEAGELCIRGPQVMKGYWNQPEETSQVLSEDGWLRTGDIATIDEDGYVQIVDRKKDMILISGFNVYPNEIEGVIAELDGVKEVAVVGVKDDEKGEQAKAFIVKDGDLEANDVIEHCRKYLTAYKVPKIIEFKDELPKTNVGKILRRALK